VLFRHFSIKIRPWKLTPADLPDDIDALKAMLLVAQAENRVAQARNSEDAALIAHLQLLIEKMKREKFGPRAERSARLLDQLELQLEEACAAATEDDLAAEQATAQSATPIAAHSRRRLIKKPLPAHLPRERVVAPGPTSAPAVVARISPSWARISPRRWR
jgi:transposase